MSNSLPPQSPIDPIKANPTTRQYDPSEAHLDWSSVAKGTLDPDGIHGPEVIFEAGQGSFTVKVPGASSATEFNLWKLHFHSPSEHLLGGETNPLELHIVHEKNLPPGSSPDRIFAVVGVMVVGGGPENSDADKELGKIINQIQRAGFLEREGPRNKTVGLEDDLLPVALVPFDEGTPLTDVPFWQYEGSLTSNLNAPNTGPVSWFVLKPKLRVSDRTLEQWKTIRHHAKEIQPLDQHKVYFNPGKISGPRAEFY